ncbi:MAG: hypothetical protein HOY79_28315 [Streptomyces sp.]|nr:hypothetical protein [Streptomyces sp.]
MEELQTVRWLFLREDEKAPGPIDRRGESAVGHAEASLILPGALDTFKKQTLNSTSG